MTEKMLADVYVGFLLPVSKDPGRLADISKTSFRTVQNLEYHIVLLECAYHFSENPCLKCPSGRHAYLSMP